MFKRLNRFLFACGLFIFFSNLAAAKSVDYTGHYVDTRSGLGLDQKQQCFEGAPYVSVNYTTLVQRGSVVCGNYFHCAFANCNKIYEGKVAGSVIDGKLVLYRESGHHGTLEIEPEVYG
jgi:hypothetical protein